MPSSPTTSGADWTWCRSWSTDSLLRPEVEHHHVRHHRPEHLAERLVVFVDEIGVAVLGGRERENEAVGEPLVVLLRAHVGAPLQRLDPGDLLLQPGEALL